MNSSLRLVLAAGLFAASMVAAQARIEHVVEKNFIVNGAGTLRVETQGGAIRVTPSTDSTVHVSAQEKINASTEAEAAELLKKLELTLEQNGNDVRLVARYERQPAGFHVGSWPPVQVDFVVSVPASFATDLHTSGGGISVGDLAGKAELKTSGGGIKLGKMGG